MENKNVGWLLIGLAILVGIMLYLFTHSAKVALDDTCPIIESGQYCPAYAAINNNLYFSLAIVGVLIIVGIFLIVSKPKLLIKKVNSKKQEKFVDVSHLKKEEKDVLRIVQSNKAIFQADLIEKTGFGKAKVTRILDRLEGIGIIERKRRGMTNIVVLKN